MSSETVQWLMVCAITQGGKADDPHVDTDCSLRCRYRFFFFVFRLDGNVPFASSLADGDVFDPACDVTTFPVAYPSYLRQIYSAVSLFQFDALRVADAVPNTLALESGKVCPFAKEVPVRRFKVFQTLLKYLAVTVFQPLEFAFPFR